MVCVFVLSNYVCCVCQKGEEADWLNRTNVHTEYPIWVIVNCDFGDSFWKVKICSCYLRVLCIECAWEKDFLFSYCYIISIVVVIWGYPSLVGFSCELWLSGETHLRWVCDKVQKKFNTKKKKNYKSCKKIEGKKIAKKIKKINKLQPNKIN